MTNDGERKEMENRNAETNRLNVKAIKGNFHLIQGTNFVERQYSSCATQSFWVAYGLTNGIMCICSVACSRSQHIYVHRLSARIALRPISAEESKIEKES